MKQKVIQEFFDKQIVKVNVSEPFILTSGKTSPVYIDHRKIFSFPMLRDLIFDLWTQVLTQNHPNINYNHVVFAGTATAGIAPAYGLASKLGAGFVYVRSKPKGHGLKALVEGFVPEGSQIIVVDDMVTTGGSILQAVDSLKKEFPHSVVLCATSISRHESESTIKNFQDNHCSLVSLFRVPEIFEIAFNTGLIDKSTFEVIKKNPA